MTTRYFDDLVEGQSERSPARTLTEADIVAFSGLSGDYNALHSDAVHAASTPFGRPIAHGLLGTAIASGLFTRTELAASLQDSLIALLAIEAQFSAPIFPGDTIHVEATVERLAPTSDGARGVATIRRRVINQDGVVAQEIVTPMLLRRRP